AAVLKVEPDWRLLPATTPPTIRTLLRRCLQKDVTQRLRDAADLRIEIQDTLNAPATGTPRAAAVTARPFSRRALPWAAGVLAGAIVAGLAVWNLKPVPASPPRPVSRAVIALPQGAR